MPFLLRNTHRLRRNVASTLSMQWRQRSGQDTSDVAFVTTTLVAAATAAVLLSEPQTETWQTRQNMQTVTIRPSSWYAQMMRLPLLVSVERVQCDGWLDWATTGESADTLKRKKTIENLTQKAERGRLEDRFDVQWREPVGEGAFGLVYKARDKKTGETVAIKAVPRSAEYNSSFQREIDALVYLRENGGHSSICQLRANYHTDEYFYLVLDFIEGGEMCTYWHVAAWWR